jgi:hypothetical protein
LITAARAQENLEIKYDAGTDKTTVTTKTHHVSGDPLNGLHIKLVGLYHGRDIKPTDQMGLIVFCVSEDGLQFRKNKDKELSFLVDGKKVKIGEVYLAFQEYDLIRFMQGLYARIDLPTLTRIANATKAEGKVGSKEFTLNQELQGAIKAFVEYFSLTQKK